MKNFLRLLSLALALSGALLGSSAAASTCNLGTTDVWDKSGSCVGVGRVPGCETARSYLFNRWRYSGKSYLLISSFTSVDILDVTDPFNPVLRYDAPSNVPWGVTPPVSDYDELQYDAAMIDDYPYGIAMFDHYGWVAFQVNNPTSPNGYTIKSSYRISGAGDSAEEPKFCRLFRGSDGQVYAVGSYLDKHSPSVAVTSFSDPTNLTVVASSVPGVSSSDELETAPIGGSWYLFASLHPGLGIYDMSTPSSPSQVATLTPTGGVEDMYVDRDTSRLFILAAFGTPQKISVYDITTPSSPALLTTIPLANIGLRTFQTVAGHGDLVVTSQYDISGYPSPYMQAFSLANPTAPVEIAAGELDLPAHPDEFTSDLEVLQGSNGDYAIYRDAFSILSFTRIASSCLSTAPRAVLQVTGGTSGLTCGTNPDARGFPGDTFTFTDSSTGVIASRTFHVTDTGSNVVFTSTWNGTAWSPALTWATANGLAPGQYVATLTAYDQAGTPSVATRTIWICSNPAAALTVTVGGQACSGSCSGLVGDTVALNASARTGNPSGYTFVSSFGGTPTVFASSSPTWSFPLSSAGAYQEGVVVHYAFAATSDDSCSDPLFAGLGLDTNNTFDSCRVGPPIQAGQVTAAIAATQNGLTVSPGGSIQRSLDLNLSWSGRVATGLTPTFAWSISPGTWTSTAQNPTIPGGTLAAGSYTVSVTAYAGGEQATANLSFTATDATFTFTATPNPVAAGAAVTLKLTNVTGNFSAVSFNVGGTTCAGTAVLIDCGSIFGGGTCSAGMTTTFAYDATAVGTRTITAQGALAAGGSAPAANSVAMTVTTGQCPQTCPTPTISSITPSTATVNVAKTFTTSASAGTGHTITNYHWVWGDGTSATDTTSSSASHTYTSTGSKTLAVMVTNDCGQTNSGSVVVTVGSGGSGSLAITPNPATANIGDTITFTFSPAMSQSTDQLTFNFGDGSQQAITGSGCQIGACPSSVTHTYTTSGTKSVSASGTVGGVSVSGSTSVTIQAATCTEPSVPTASFTFTPNQPIIGQSVSFTDTSTGNPTSWSWSFGDSGLFGNGGGTSTQKNPTYVYSAAGTFTVALVATNCKGSSAPAQVQITVLSNCQQTASPVANFTWLPVSPVVNTAVQFTDSSTNIPSSWAWDFGDGGSSTQQNPSHTYTTAGTYQVKLTASNCKGPSAVKQLAISVTPPCTQTAPPTADFTWQPTGTVTIGGVQQQQPYPGQQVTLQDTSTNSPTSWSWDFGDGSTSAVQNPVHTWSSAGTKTVKLIATNCFGTSTEKDQTVTVYADVRGVTADFTYSPTAVATDSPVTFTALQGSAYGDPTSFTWKFADTGEQMTGASVTHTFACGGSIAVTLTAQRGSMSGQVTKMLSVSGQVCALVATGAARTPGLNGTFWRTDARIFNPSAQATRIWLEALLEGRDNSNPTKVGPFPVAAKATAVFNDVLGSQFGLQNQKANILVTYDPQDVNPVVMLRTYTNGSGGGTYGQSGRGEPVPTAGPTSPLWIAGASNDGLTDGYRTNLGLANLQGTAGVGGIVVTLYKSDGTSIAKSFGLAPFGYLHDSITNLFGTGFSNIGPFAVKVETPAGADVQSYLSTVDNRTGDPSLFSAQAVPSSTLTVPAIAHLNGLNETVWRSDAEITNPDTSAHQWKLQFTPRQSLPIVAQTVSVPPLETTRITDLVSFLYQPFTVPEASGVLEVTPADGSQVYPAISASTYNQTSDGTFGQTIPALTAADGATASGPYTRLFVTGMSSADVARSSFGFVNLGATGANVDVLFYDENGNVLNPGGTVYGIYLAPGQWDQDLLENRLHTTLPLNTRAISAEVVVRVGGPVYVYASVVDNATGDPIFVGGQLAP